MVPKQHLKYPFVPSYCRKSGGRDSRSADISGLEGVFGSKQRKYMYVLTMNLTDISLEFLKLF